MPRAMLIPLSKPQTDPAHCRSKGSIALIHVLSGGLDAVVLSRLMGASMDGRQNAYTRDRGADTHPLGFLALAKGVRGRRKYVYMAAVGAVRTAKRCHILSCCARWRHMERVLTNLDISTSGFGVADSGFA